MLPEIKSIKNRRKLLGLTQKDLAKQAGVSQSFIAKMESGRINPSYNHVKQ
ncbi:MAG: helix-turn-helix domain-containing protein, partial [Candidatus Aenigmarchaeota archaeon]|nr:helix-turn-helix domain-containing protein [Candidatus Aenigmarchaeota archaeon]